MKTSSQNTGFIDGFIRLTVAGLFIVGYPVAVLSGSIILKTTNFICEIWEEFRPEKEGDNY